MEDESQPNTQGFEFWQIPQKGNIRMIRINLVLMIHYGLRAEERSFLSINLKGDK